MGNNAFGVCVGDRDDHMTPRAHLFKLPPATQRSGHGAVSVSFGDATPLCEQLKGDRGGDLHRRSLPGKLRLDAPLGAGPEPVLEIVPPILVHIYDRGHVQSNAAAIMQCGRAPQAGIFHCGVEVLGDEWAYSGRLGHDLSLEGVTKREPLTFAQAVYHHKETLNLGPSRLPTWQLRQVLSDLAIEWRASDYDLAKHNCIHFTKALTERLQCSERLPDWVCGPLVHGFPQMSAQLRVKSKKVLLQGSKAALGGG